MKASYTSPVASKIESSKVEKVEDLRRLIISRTEMENGMLHLTLSGTGEWEEDGKSLFIYGKTSFDVSMLKNNLQAISNYVHKYFARHLKVEILKEEKRGCISGKVNVTFHTEGEFNEVSSEYEDTSVSKHSLQNSEAVISQAVEKNVEASSNKEKDIPHIVKLVMEVFDGKLVGV